MYDNKRTYNGYTFQAQLCSGLSEVVRSMIVRALCTLLAMFNGVIKQSNDRLLPVKLSL